MSDIIESENSLELSDDSDFSINIMDSSSDDDDEYLELIEERKRPKNKNYFETIIPKRIPNEFIEHFRVSREIADRFEGSEYYHYQSGCNGKISSLKQTLTFLWFAGHQTSSFRDVADRFDIAISTLFVIIQRMTYFLSNMSGQVITWPTENEQNVIKAHFAENEFPRVTGVIDGSHIKIDKPTEDSDSYLNRKNFVSIQMQVVCDHSRKIRDIFVGYPDSVHDSRVFRTSPLSDNLLQLCQDSYMLGDSGYPCLTHLLTPYCDRGQLRPVERNYNRLLAKNRYVIEHCFGLLKQKFGQMYHVKLRRIRDIVHFIRACCVLHNLAVEDDFPYEENVGMNEVEENVNLNGENTDDEMVDDRNGFRRRNFVANNILNF